MTFNHNTLGFSYFSLPEFLLTTNLETWLHLMHTIGASSVIFQSYYKRSIPEDPFILCHEFNLEPIVHFPGELPHAKEFNDISVLLEIYAKRGVEKIIFGDRPNLKTAWSTTGWHFDNLVNHFIERFIPLANFSIQLGLKPIIPPMQPGGDYWDTSFFESVITILKNRQVDSIIENLVLSSYGLTFGKPLSWGMGGPERWPASKPYLTPDGQEDQIGFNNYEWISAIAECVLGVTCPIIILDAGMPGMFESSMDSGTIINSLQRISEVILTKNTKPDRLTERVAFKSNMIGCFFSMDKIKQLMNDQLTPNKLNEIFGQNTNSQNFSGKNIEVRKCINQYLLLPSYANTISDVVLNKVRPIIKQLRPTVGFSLEEACFAEKVFVYPDPILFSEEEINKLREKGCIVEILPESGIDIATRLQGLPIKE